MVSNARESNKTKPDFLAHAIA